MLSRAKFDAYIEREIRKLLVNDYAEAAKPVAVNSSVTDCIDRKDNKFLALALDAGAKLIVSGDKRLLLSMHPYRGIAILGMREFIDIHPEHGRTG